MENNSDPKHKDNKVDPIQRGGLVVAHSTTDDSVERDGYKDPKFVVRYGENMHTLDEEVPDE